MKINKFIVWMLIFLLTGAKGFMEDAPQVASLPSGENTPASTFSYNGSGNYRLTERTDLRRYDNGKYTGLVSRIVTSFINPSRSPDGGSDYYYDGNFFLTQGTKTVGSSRNYATTLSEIDTSIPSSFKITKKGELVMLNDNGYPTFRSFPAFPPTPVKIGQMWRAKAVRVVDPKDDGKITRLPIEVEYTYLKNEKYHDEDVYTVRARWATRYGMNYRDYNGDPNLSAAQGRHDATMYISCKTGNAIVVRDVVDETFAYSNGDTVGFKGTISLFTEYPPAHDNSQIIHALERAGFVKADEAKDLLAKSNDQKKVVTATSVPVLPVPAAGEGVAKNSTPIEPPSQPVEPPPQNDVAQDGRASDNDLAESLAKNASLASGDASKVTVEKTDAGLTLTLHDLHFVPDSAELLESDKALINEIATVLKSAPDRKFLIEGHTALTGNPRGELQLSKQRAQGIATLLSQYGISADKFITRGFGGTKPVADNSTKEGKAKNRRVEITILD